MTDIDIDSIANRVADILWQRYVAEHEKAALDRFNGIRHWLKEMNNHDYQSAVAPGSCLYDTSGNLVGAIPLTEAEKRAGVYLDKDGYKTVDVTIGQTE